jgi:hypothetical protein
VSRFANSEFAARVSQRSHIFVVDDDKPTETSLSPEIRLSLRMLRAKRLRRACARLCLPRVSLVRACLAILLSVLTWASTVPYLFVRDAPELPSCCRRDGKHHCHKNLESPTAGSALDSPVRLEGAPCPRFPKAAKATTHRVPSIAIRIVASNVIPSQSITPAIYWLNRSSLQAEAHLKRGPPQQSTNQVHI